MNEPFPSSETLMIRDGPAPSPGIVTQTDILDKTVWERPGPRLGFGRRIRLTLTRGRAPHGCVEDVMTSPVRTARADTPISDLVMWMSKAGLHHLPVVGSDEKLIGIVSQTDLVSQMLADAVERADVPA